MTKIRSSIALVVGCVWALGLGGAALAADMSMPLKAPPPPAPPPLDIHGFVEWDWESFLINPQGQALINHGTGTVVAGLDWVLYKNKAGFINKISTGGGLAADLSDNFPGYCLASSVDPLPFNQAQLQNLAQAWTGPRDIDTIEYFEIDQMTSAGPSPDCGSSRPSPRWHRSVPSCRPATATSDLTRRSGPPSGSRAAPNPGC